MVRASTNTGRPTDLYRSRLPSHSGSGGASGEGGEDRREAVPLGVSGQGALISPLVDAYLVVGVGDHSVADNMHGIDIPTVPEVVPNKLLRLDIEGRKEEDTRHPHRDIEDPFV